MEEQRVRAMGKHLTEENCYNYVLGMHNNDNK